MDSISFHVFGTPAPKGSTTRMPNGATLPAGTPASRKRFGEWRTDIKQRAIQAMEGESASTRPIRLMCEFQLPVPTSSIRKYQTGWLPHVKRPDVDKLMRALLDALTGIVWVDDSQVCYAMVNKVYAWNGQPGADIIIDFINDDVAVSLARSQMKVRDVIDSL
jgi:crossover junction endodeoxyribonuclease RusA